MGLTVTLSIMSDTKDLKRVSERGKRSYTWYSPLFYIRVGAVIRPTCIDPDNTSENSHAYLILFRELSGLKLECGQDLSTETTHLKCITSGLFSGSCYPS